MRYATYEFEGQRRVGLVERQAEGDRLVPLADLREIGRDTPTGVLASATPLPHQAIDAARARLCPVVPNPSKIICAGLNYRAHVGETGRALLEYPVLFTKFASNLIGAGEPIVLPGESAQVDYEAELAVVIGKFGRRIPPERAREHVLGYTVANDITMRDYQYKTHQWLQGKAWDRATPVGPYLVTPDGADSAVGSASAGIRTILGGRKLQESNTSRLIFDVPALISTVSTFTQLVPGDLLLTGTPGGVGYRRNPQVFLAEGDEITVEVDGIGCLTNPVRRETTRAGTFVEAAPG